MKSNFQKEEEKIAQILAKNLGYLYFDLRITKPDNSVICLLDKETALKSKSLTLFKKGNQIILGVVDPYNPEVSKIIENLKNQGYIVVLAIISPQSFEIGFKEYRFLEEKSIKYTKIFEIDQKVIEEIQNKIAKKEDLENYINKLSVENPFLILDYLLAGALKFKASDIHFEPKENEVLARYRLDGLLYEVGNFPLKIYRLIKNRIKVLAGMKIDIVNFPQDGRFSMVFQNKNIDFRVSVIPSFEEESIVLRILIFSQINKKLEELGLREDDLEILNNAIHQPNGLILNTGPTGSGKTTTLYAIILRIKKPELKIITIENPVEYKIEGITQAQIDEESGFTFASALKAYLRQDPDVILVGEIRDKETANTAIQASLTGHLVLSTLHTNDSLGSVPRLISLEVDPKLIPSALRLAIAQRLIRKVCPYCHEKYSPDEATKEKIRKNLENLPSRVDLKVDLNNFTLVKAKGCDLCFSTGYQGRIGIFELLKIDKNLEELIYKKPSETEIYETIKNNFVSLKQDALIKALWKITTLEEVERVVGVL